LGEFYIPKTPPLQKIHLNPCNSNRSRLSK
jgi:hypothetical protein